MVVLHTQNENSLPILQYNNSNYIYKKYIYYQVKQSLVPCTNIMRKHRENPTIQQQQNKLSCQIDLYLFNIYIFRLFCHKCYQNQVSTNIIVDMPLYRLFFLFFFFGKFHNNKYNCPFCLRSI